MVLKKMFFFMSGSPIHFIKYGIQALININNSKNQLNYQLNIATLKSFANYKIFYEMFFFSSQIYLKATFYTAQSFLY